MRLNFKRLIHQYYKEDPATYPIEMRQSMDEKINEYILGEDGLEVDERVYLFHEVLSEPAIEEAERNYRQAVSFISFNEDEIAFEELKIAINQNHQNARMYFTTCVRERTSMYDLCCSFMTNNRRKQPLDSVVELSPFAELLLTFDDVVRKSDIESGELNYKQALYFISLDRFEQAFEAFKEGINKNNVNAMRGFAICFSKHKNIRELCKPLVTDKIKKRQLDNVDAFDLFSLLVMTLHDLAMIVEHNGGISAISYLDKLFDCKKLDAFVSRFHEHPKEMSVITSRIRQGGSQFYMSFIKDKNVNTVTHHWLSFDSEKITFLYDKLLKIREESRLYTRYIKMFFFAPCLLESSNRSSLNLFFDCLNSALDDTNGLHHTDWMKIQDLSRNVDIHLLLPWMLEVWNNNKGSPISFSLITAQDKFSKYVKFFFSCLIGNVSLLVNDRFSFDEIKAIPLQYLLEDRLIAFMTRHELSFRRDMTPLYSGDSFFHAFDSHFLGEMIKINPYFNFTEEQKSDLVNRSLAICAEEKFALDQTLKIFKNLNINGTFTSQELAFKACVGLLTWMSSVSDMNKVSFIKLNSNKKEYTNYLLTFLTKFKFTSEIDVIKPLILQSNDNVRKFIDILPDILLDKKSNGYPLRQVEKIDSYALKLTLFCLMAVNRDLRINDMKDLFYYCHRIDFDKRPEDLTVVELLRSKISLGFMGTFDIFFQKPARCSVENLNKLITTYPALAAGQMTDRLLNLRFNGVDHLDVFFNYVRENGLRAAIPMIRGYINRTTQAYALENMPARRQVEPPIPARTAVPMVDLDTHKASTHFGSNLTSWHLLYLHRDSLSEEKIQKTYNNMCLQIREFLFHSKGTEIRDNNFEYFCQLATGFRYLVKLNNCRAPITYILTDDKKREMISELSDDGTREMLHISTEDYEQLNTTKNETARFYIKDFVMAVFLECSLKNQSNDLNEILDAFLMACYECGRGYDIRIDKHGDLIDSTLKEIANKLKNDGASKDFIREIDNALMRNNSAICAGGHMNKFCEKLSSFSNNIHFLSVTEAMICYKVQHLFFAHVEQMIESMKESQIDHVDNLVELINTGDPKDYFIEKFEEIRESIIADINRDLVLNFDKGLSGKVLETFYAILMDLNSISEMERDIENANREASPEERKILLNNYYPERFVRYIREMRVSTLILTSSSSSADDETSRKGKRKHGFFQGSSSSTPHQEEEKDMDVVDDLGEGSAPKVLRLG